MSISLPIQDLRIRSHVERTPRGAATRAKLISVAERLFAERGIEGVTLVDINQAADQRNRNAMQYHFGDKKGVVQAILDKHLPGIALRRNQMLDEMEAHGRKTVRDVVRALIYPVAEKLFDGDGGREFIRINAQLVSQHTMGAIGLQQSDFQIGQQQRLANAISLAMSNVPSAVASQRSLLAAVLLFEGLASHITMIERSTASAPSINTELFIRNLEDCIVAVFDAPLSAQTRDLLSQP